MDGIELSPKIECEADRLLAQIALADSMIVAAKAGARAEGVVLGLNSARALSEATIDRLYVIFDSATEQVEIADHNSKPAAFLGRLSHLQLTDDPFFLIQDQC